MFSAGGSLRSEVRHDVAITFLSMLADVSPAAIETRFAEAETRLLALFDAEAEGGGPSSVDLSIEIRFAGQIFAQDVPIELPFDAARVEAAFRSGYAATFGYHLPHSSAEIVNLTVVARAVRADEPEGGGCAPSPGFGTVSNVSHLALARDGSLIVQPVLTRGDLRDGRRQGPLTLADEGATILLPPEWWLETGECGSLRAWTEA